VRYARLLRLRLQAPHVLLRGMVFLGRRVELSARPGYGRLEIGRWVHIGDGNSLRCHEGSLRIGDKVVFGKDNTVNCYLDVEIGAASMVADWSYVCDFDHRTHEDDGTPTKRPIKDLGLVKTPVRIGPGCWLGVRSTVLRGTTMGSGCVLAAHAVARGSYPDDALIAGVPGRVVRKATSAPAARGVGDVTVLRAGRRR
jgi:acetyltransferase-like isoleucine patch superfamily enzyme